MKLSDTALSLLGPVAVALVIAGAYMAKVPETQAAECAGRSGIASFYGSERQGRLMANGLPFNRHALTAASWDYPLGTVLIVRNVQNGRSVQVRVTDRGPAHYLHRIIDLSESAAGAIGLTRRGLGPVCLERVG